MTGGASGSSVREQGNVPLQCIKLTDMNYTTWALMMEIILKSFGLWKVIDKTDGKKETNGKQETAIDEKAENTAKGMIFQTLPQDMLMQVAQYNTTKEVWNSIKVKHLGADLVHKARLQTLRSELETLKMKPNESANEFAGTINDPTRGSSRGWREAEAYVRYYSKNAPIKKEYPSAIKLIPADDHYMKGFSTTKVLGVEVCFGRHGAAGNRQVNVLKFFDCPGPRQGVEDLRELLHKGAQRDREAEVFQVSNDDTVVAQGRVHGQKGAKDNATERYGEDSNEDAFAVAVVEKIYAHESLNFNETVACKAEIWVTKGLLVKAKKNILGLEIIRDQSGDTLR
nr:zinc finger, CCHC-type [Tanacetum cinerariifolium]